MNKFATHEEIEYAHSIILNGKPDFEQDKIDIIECNESQDIKACPGSGKTTTLLTKLIILANRMPLPNNQGICVLTHTNVAIDEIKNKLGHKADILFKYPNHFGTIQSFVDKFLAIPALKKHYNTNIRKVDTDIANKLLLSEFLKLDPFKDKLHTLLYMRLYESLSQITDEDINDWINKSQITTLKQDLITAGIIVEKGKRVKKIYLDSKKSSWKTLNQIFPKNKNICSIIYVKRKEINKQIDIQKKEFVPALELNFINQNISKDSLSVKFSTDSGKSFLGIKEKIFEKGILSFQDAYSLAFRYCHELKNIQNILSSRFKYLFIDEMQDTDKHQIDIIEKVFDKQKTIIQQFGDHRQAIYQNRVNVKEQWNPQNSLPINSSKRFGENIAKVLRYVCCEKNENLKANSNITSLPPVMILFDNPEDVLPKFCKLLISKKVNGKNIWDISQEIKKEKDTSYKIKAIGWVGTNDPDKLTIKSYFVNYNSQARKKDKVDYDSLKSFLRKQEDGKLLDYSNKIVDVLLHILSLANKKYYNGDSLRNYTKTTLLEDFENKSSEKFLLLKSNIAKWSKNIHDSESFCIQTINEIKEYIKSEFCPIFDIAVENENITLFLENDSANVITDIEIKNNNVYKHGEIEIDVATIHSVKGETHTATLYLETSYYSKCESEYIADQLSGNYYIPSKDKDTYIKETLKMAHVGMSRPKYFLCIAIHNSRFKNSFDINNGGLWEIVNV
jgi:superfamily I DNA/RNA helicase